MTFGQWAEEHGGSIRYFVVALVWAVFLPAVVLTGLISLPFVITPAAVVAAPLLVLCAWLFSLFVRYMRWLREAGEDWRVPDDCLVRYLPWYLPAIYYGIILAAAFLLAATSRGDSLYTVMGSMPHFFVWTFGLSLIQTYMEGPDAAFATLWSTIGLSLVLAGCMTVYFRKISQPAKKRVRGAAVIAVAFACVAVAVCVAYMDLRSHVLPKSRGNVAVVREGPKIRRGPWETDDFSPYEPFSAGNRLVKIESPGLKIAADHPKIYAAISFYPLAAAAVEAIYEGVGEKQVREEKLLHGGTSPQTFDALLDGDADMVFMFRPSEEQMAKAEAAGKALTVTPIGREAFVFFVSMVNPVEGLSAAEIRNIYAKKTTRWDAVGGKREQILAFQRPEGSGSQTAMERFMGDVPLPPPVQEEFQVSMRGIVNRVANYRNYGNSLGYSFRFYVQGMSADAGVKLLAVDGVAPTVEHIGSGAYPLVEEVVIVTADSGNPHVAELVAWFLSPEGQELVERVGYVRND